MISFFSDNLKGLRLQEKLTQVELAQRLGCTQRKVSYWEMGKIEPDIMSLIKISEYFDISIDGLLKKKMF